MQSIQVAKASTKRMHTTGFCAACSLARRSQSAASSASRFATSLTASMCARRRPTSWARQKRARDARDRCVERGELLQPGRVATSKALRCVLHDSRQRSTVWQRLVRWPTRPAHKIARIRSREPKGLPGDVQIDSQAKRSAFDFRQDAWSTTVYLNGHYYDVSSRQGKPDQPICEFDNQRRRIYVNWGHPVKLHMDDATFLKSAIFSGSRTTRPRKTRTQ